MGACNTCDLDHAQQGSNMHKSRETTGTTGQTSTYGQDGETSKSLKQACRARAAVNETSETYDTSVSTNANAGNEEKEEAPNTHDSDLNGGEQPSLVVGNESHSAHITDSKTNENEVNKKGSSMKKDPFAELFDKLVTGCTPLPLSKEPEKEFVYDPNSEGAKWWADWWVQYCSDRAQVLESDKEYILKSFNSHVETHKIRDEEWNGNVIMVYSSKFQGIVYICWTHAQYVEYLLMA